MPTAAITSSIEVASKPLSSTEASATSRICSLVSAPLCGVSCICRTSCGYCASVTARALEFMVLKTNDWGLDVASAMRPFASRFSLSGPARRTLPRVHLKTSLAEPLEWPPNLAARNVLKIRQPRRPIPCTASLLDRRTQIPHFLHQRHSCRTPTQGAKHRGETSKIPGAAAATWRRPVPHRWRIGDDAYLSRRLGASSFRSFRPPQRPDRTHAASRLFRPLCFYGDRSRGRLHPGKPDLARQF